MSLFHREMVQTVLDAQPNLTTLFSVTSSDSS